MLIPNSYQVCDCGYGFLIQESDIGSTVECPECHQQYSVFALNCKPEYNFVEISFNKC